MTARQPTTLRTEVLVIGAGQAGLAAGYHLQRLGIAARIVEADDRVGDVWRRRYDALKLYSPAGYDSLPGMPFRSRSAHSRPAARWPTTSSRTPAASGSWSTRVSGSSGWRPRSRRPAFRRDAGERRYEAGQVIVATGAFQRPRVPAFATELDPAIRQLHSSDYRNPVAARRRSGPGRRAEPLGRRPRPRDRREPPGDRVGQIARANPGSARQPARPSRLLGVPAFLWHVATLDTPIGRRMAPEVKKGGGPLLRWRKPELKAAGVELTDAADDRRRRRQTGARRRPGARRRERPVVHRLLERLRWIRPPIKIDEAGWPVQCRGVSSVPGPVLHGRPLPVLVHVDARPRRRPGCRIRRGPDR